MKRAAPSIATMFRRALLRCCPWCGARKTFIRRWLGRYDRCRTCGIKWHREHGFELGPTSLNVVITFFILGVGMVVGFVATAPDFNVGVLTTVFIALAIIVPIVAYPWTYTLWLAVDLAAHPPDERELAEAAAAADAAANA
ncbi:MAG TPA: DUF983 domain-containing protein [Ilumatobacteraceae bacterium]|nr:DUF983 domain-containing protein [Ilumatobacteraceae bacterium]HUC32403.1 DUF983 domain-containing protein [Ilumatobacteraceae bacterium]